MVRFLHIADKPFTTWKEEGGRVLPRIAKPNGFWIARDLTWVTLMDQARDWTPRPDKEAPGREPVGRIHAAVSHAVDGTDIAVATEGEAKPLPWAPLFVYVLEIPESSFSTDLDTPDPTQILRISRANLDALLAGYASFSRAWATTEAPSEPLVRDAIESVLQGPDKARAKALAKTALGLKTDPAAYEILAKVKSVGALVLEVLEGRLTVPSSQTIIPAVAWKAFTAQLRKQWGGLEFMPDLFTPEEMGLSYPYAILTDKLGGIIDQQLVVVTSGSGLGKSTFIREVAFHLHSVHKKQVGMIMLEEGVKKTLKAFIGLHLNKRIKRDLSNTTPAEMEQAAKELFSERDLILYNHFGSTDIDNICSRIRYMAKAMDCKYIFLDHLSILVSGIQTDDERKMIDVGMTKLRTLVQETGICLFIVSHLKRPSGDKGHEDGATVNLGQLRGSHAIAQLSDACIGLQKSPDDPTSDSTELVVLKNREEGERGSAGIVNYDKETGRLTESVF